MDSNSLNEENVSLPQFFAGILFVALLILVVWLNRPSNPIAVSDYLVLHATFPSIESLSSGDTVRMSGIKIGHVGNIGFTDGSNQSVTISFHITYPDIINGDLFIPDDSSIRLVTPSLFSGKELLVEPGSSMLALENEDFFLFTQNSFTLDSLLRYFFQDAPSPS